MRFAIRAPAFIMGQYLNANPQNPQTVDLPDDISSDHISSSWEPLDEKALARQAEILKLNKMPVPTEHGEEPQGAVKADLAIDPSAILARPASKVLAEQGTMSERQGAAKK